MPSTKDPVVVVQPGPGRSPEGTVTASSLDFPPTAGSNAALQAHINNPVGAHQDSAISTDGFGGVSRWADPAGSVESALTVAYDGLNARAVYVLDANPASTDADYSGPSALSLALAVVPAGDRGVFFLRAGVYTFSTSLSNIELIGASLNSVEIQSTGALTIGKGAVLRNLYLTVNGNLNVSGSSGLGFNTFDNVAVNVTGDVNVSSTNNTFNKFVSAATHTLSAADLYINDTGGLNTYNNIVANQIFVNSDRNHFNSVTMGTIGLFSLPPKVGGQPQFQIFGTGNHVNGLLIDYNGAVTAAPLEVDGSGSCITNVIIDVTNTTQGVFVVGSNNTLNAVTIQNTSCSSNGFMINLGVRNVVEGLFFNACQIAASFASCSISSDNNTITGMQVSSFVGSVDALLNVSGDYNVVTGLKTLSGVASGGSFVKLSGRGNKLSGFNPVSVTHSVGVISFLNIAGTANRVDSTFFENVGTVRVPCVFFNGAVDCEVDKTTISGLSAFTGAGFQLVNMTNSRRCVASDIDIATSANLGTTSGLLFMSGCSNCTIDGVYINNSGTTTAINSPILTASTTLNDGCVVRNVVSSLSSYAPGTLLFSIDQSYWTGLTVENCNIQEQISGSSVVKFFNSGSAAQSTGVPIVFRDCVFANSNASGGKTVFADTFGAKVIFERCSISAGGAAVHAVYTISVWDFTFLDCNITAVGPTTLAASATYSGTTFERCTFRGPGGGNSGTQLFNGFGYSETIIFPNAPLVIKNCMMIVGQRNVATATSTTPIVFFGGEGSTPLGALGPVVVDGLVITANAALSPGWHPGPTLAIIVDENIVSNSQTSYANITIDLLRSGWNVAGTNCSIFPSDFNTNGAVVEIKGGNPTTTNFVFVKPMIKNLAIRGVNRDGQGPRHIIKASGCAISGLSIDGLSFGTETSYAAETVLLKHVDLRESQLFTNSSVLIGAFAHVRADTCTIEKVMVNNLTANVVPDSSYIFDLTTSVLRDCRILANAARLDFVIKVPNSTCYIENNRIQLSGGVALTGSVINVAAGNNVISGNFISSSATSVGIDVTGSGNVVKDNRFLYAISTSTVAGIRSSGDYNRILSNHLEKSTALSTGLLQIHLNGGNYCQVSDNVITTEFSTVATQLSAINSSCYMAKITDNTVRNSHTNSGSIGITSTGDYTNVSGNRVWCNHSSFANASFINATGNNQTIVANHVENNNGGNSGVIATGATFLPTPVASYNQLT